MMRLDPVPATTNTRALDLVARADGSPITAGTVNYYLVAITGANAGKWFKHSDQTWNAGETICHTMAHKGDGHWLTTDAIHADGWIDGVEYAEYAKESGNLHVPISHTFLCHYRPVITSAGVQRAFDATGNAVGTSANQTTILNRLGGWTGSARNTILGALQALFRKDADATVPSDVNADLGSGAGTADNTTDSTQGIRDRGDSAWITAVVSGLALESTLTAIKGATFDTNTDSLEAIRNRGDSAWITAVVSGLALEATLTSIKGATFDTNTDSLEALRNRGDSAWITAVVSGLALESTLTAIKGGGWNASTDSLEAIRDRGDSAWITATGFAVAGDVTGAHAATDGLISALASYGDAHWTTAVISGLALEATLTAIKGATWNASTDSLEAIRDRGDSAWITADLSALATSVALAAVAGNVTTILADTNELQIEWADGGRLDVILDARSSHTAAQVVAALLANVTVSADGSTTLGELLEQMHTAAVGDIAKSGDAYAFKDTAGDTLFTLTMTASARTKS